MVNESLSGLLDFADFHSLNVETFAVRLKGISDKRRFS